MVCKGAAPPCNPTNYLLFLAFGWGKTGCVFCIFFKFLCFAKVDGMQGGCAPLQPYKLFTFSCLWLGQNRVCFLHFFQIPLFRQSRWYARGLRPLATLQIIYFFLPLVGAKPGVFIVLFVKSFVAWIYFRFIIGFALLCLLGRSFV